MINVPLSLSRTCSDFVKEIAIFDIFQLVFQSEMSGKSSKFKKLSVGLVCLPMFTVEIGQMYR